MSLLYKTLFEVKLTHEFYVTNSDGNTIFTLPTQAERIDFLDKLHGEDRDTVNEDLDFIFPESMEKEYSRYNLKLLTAYSGFRVVIRVSQQKMPDGSLQFKAFTPLPDNLLINVLFSKKGNSIDRFTNTRMATALPAMYFFSNDEILTPLSFPYLTSAVSSTRLGYTYEQGELASFGPSDIRSYYRDSTSDQWDSFSGEGFANENDRLLLPLKFYYSFPEDATVANATFTLKNKPGNIVRSLAVTGSTTLNKALLDFSDLKDKLTMSSAATVNDLIYTLEVAADSGYSAAHNILFQADFYDKDVWGMAAVSIKTGDTDFDLVDADGFLIIRKNAAGVLTEAPIFEIPIKSRSAYWRYKNNKGEKIVLHGDLIDFLDKDGERILISKKPQPVAQSFLLLRNVDNTAAKYVPNPINYSIERDSSERLCFNVVVPKSDHFPVV